MCLLSPRRYQEKLERVVNAQRKADYLTRGLAFPGSHGSVHSGPGSPGSVATGASGFDSVHTGPSAHGGRHAGDGGGGDDGGGEGARGVPSPHRASGWGWGEHGVQGMEDVGDAGGGARAGSPVRGPPRGDPQGEGGEASAGKPARKKKEVRDVRLGDVLVLCPPLLGCPWFDC